MNRINFSMPDFSNGVGPVISTGVQYLDPWDEISHSFEPRNASSDFTARKNSYVESYPLEKKVFWSASTESIANDAIMVHDFCGNIDSSLVDILGVKSFVGRLQDDIRNSTVLAEFPAGFIRIFRPAKKTALSAVGIDACREAYSTLLEKYKTNISAYSFLLESDTSHIEREASWIRELLAFENMGNARDVYRKIIEHVQAQRQSRSYVALSNDLATTDVAAHEPTTLMALLRSTYSARSKINSWSWLLSATRQELQNKELPLDDYLQGLDE